MLRKKRVVFVNLTAAYDTVWHRGLTCKLLKHLPDKHIIRIIMEFVSTFTTGDSKQSRLRHLKKGASQGLVSAPLGVHIRSTCFPRFPEIVLIWTI